MRDIATRLLGSPGRWQDRCLHGPRLATGQRCADMARELEVPVPFSMDGLRNRLEQLSGRVVVLAPMVMQPGAPSGVWFRTDDADYLCYEEETSAFHQAHIVVQLAAHTLLPAATGPLTDAGLAPDLSLRLAEVMLGHAGLSLVSDIDAEDYAFRALEAISGFPSGFAARRALRQLQPLRAALIAAVPEAVHRSTSGRLSGPRSRLYWAVIEIRDAALVLRAYRDRREAAVDAAGLGGDDLAAATEAAMLAGAARARKVAQPVRPATADACQVPVFAADLGSEAEWLAKVARAFSRLPALGGGGPVVIVTEGVASVADAERL